MNHPAPSTTPGTRAGFTLIELPTVIAIVGTLASIIIPTVGKVKESALKSTCANNLHEIAVATLTHANDNKGKPPSRPNSYAFPHSFVTADWNAVMPCIGDHSKADRRYCPGALQEWRNPSTAEYGAENGNHITCSYFGNLPLTTEVQTAFGLGSQTVLTNTKTTPPQITPWACLACKNGSAWHVHSGPNTTQVVQGQNAVRADGSVRWVTGENLIPYFVSNSTFYGPAGL